MRIRPRALICCASLTLLVLPLSAQIAAPPARRPFVLPNFNTLAAPLPGESFYGSVSWVYDGDTFSVRREDGKSIRVRVGGIDCPEKAQPYGEEAGRRAFRLVHGERVRIAVVDIDDYGRVVGHVILPDGRRLGKVLLAEGLAWWYRWFSDDASLGELEAAAKAAGLGLWADPDPEPPWDYRRRTRTLEAFDAPLE